ncbi:hypothetical protein ES319_D10G035300v1 [Gossypium barbadense]|uniref:Uncharacterized protein n=2 Tax=Gossypium TaxID=3633 RepID=A0A5J5PL56_GOSBA|nr:hypothetical protein ES319_D10G035300v1 [Gossypium barbadense]TYG48700.1 hypothetical protein ES288_D10G036500v1 [Gossypium darwinii]
MLLSHTLLLLLHIGESMQQRVMIIVERQCNRCLLEGFCCIPTLVAKDPSL